MQDQNNEQPEGGYKGHSQGQSLGHLKIYNDFNAFYRTLTDKADRIHNAICLIQKYATHRDTLDRLESLGIDFLELSYLLHPSANHYVENGQPDYLSLSVQIEFALKELKTITNGLVIRGILNPESKARFDREIDMYVESIQGYTTRLVTSFNEASGSIISPLWNDDYFGKSLDMGILGTKNPNDSSQNTLKENFKDVSLNKNNPETLNTLQGQKPMTNASSQGHKTPEKNVSQGHDQSTQTQLVEYKKSDVVDRLNRKARILSFIKDKHIVSIKDITMHIGDVSEKTVQRELNDLITEGTVKKEGTRRWSTYSLKN